MTNTDKGKMKAIIEKSPIGVFAFTEQGDLLHSLVFKDEKEAIGKLQNKELPAEFLKELEGYDVEQGSGKIIRKKFRELVLSLGFAKNDSELNAYINKFGIAFSLSRMPSALSRDLLIIQASNALEDIKKTVNFYQERLWEWFSLHYPEASKKDLVNQVAQHGRRENFPGFRQSYGTEITKEDEIAFKEYAQLIQETEKQRKKLESYVKEAAKEIMPNFASLIDPLLAARFLALAGSLEKLAKMPSSTIQLLGAERALFRHLKEKGKSPKFGIIFLDVHIQNAAGDKKGKAARLLAAKLSMAARIDFYSKRSEPNLKKDLEKEMEKL